jgi:hypothetical protein
MLVLAALAALPSVSDAALEWIERPDDMQVVLFEDYDGHDDRVRLLYQTMPSLEQRAADPEGWTNNVYVVEIDAAGNIVQRRLKSDQANYAALALRRGHDELIALIRSAKTGEAERLERWSSADGSVVSSVPPPRALSRARRRSDRRRFHGLPAGRGRCGVARRHAAAQLPGRRASHAGRRARARRVDGRSRCAGGSIRRHRP